MESPSATRSDVSPSERSPPLSKLPNWKYEGLQPKCQMVPNAPSSNDTMGLSLSLLDDLSKIMEAMNLGSYQRKYVSNVTDVSDAGRGFFDMGLRLMFSYHHELAARFFSACIHFCPGAALAHGLLSLCHGPNYNFQGGSYYGSSFHEADVFMKDLECVFPSQHVADRHSFAAVGIVEELRTRSKASMDGNMISNVDVESRFLCAVRTLTRQPGINETSIYETVGRPYADAMRQVYQLFPLDPEITYFFVESLMVLNAWQLYEYPSGEPKSKDVTEIRDVLERGLRLHPNHPGLCHKYTHLIEMSAHPEDAVAACEPIRSLLPHAGHLVHMPTHIDVLVGNYENVIRFNLLAIEADHHLMHCSPSTAGCQSFYFNYMLHNYHMLIYGAILGGMESIGMKVALELNKMVNEALFRKYPSLVTHLESYSAMEVHVMVRFGRWNDLLNVDLPMDESLMLYRTASVLYGRSLALAMRGNLEDAKKEADRFDELQRKYPEVSERVLYNNSVASLLVVDGTMIRGEIAYKEGKYKEGLDLLRKAVDLQDNLNYDEPWGKMQPIRHALGGLLLEQGQLETAEIVFREDLNLHPRNPWALVGLIRCLECKFSSSKCCTKRTTDVQLEEVTELKELLRAQREMEWADFDVVVACECCVHPDD